MASMMDSETETGMVGGGGGAKPQPDSLPTIGWTVVRDGI